MMIHGHAPDPFFADALQHKAFLGNRLPHQALNDELPISKWYSAPMKPSQRASAAVLFCLCYAFVDPSQRRKNEPKATACVYLGLAEGIRGFKVLDIETNKRYVRQDVKFLSNYLPFKTTLPRTPSLINLTEEEAEDQPLKDTPQCVLPISTPAEEAAKKLPLELSPRQVAEPPADVWADQVCRRQTHSQEEERSSSPADETAKELSLGTASGPWLISSRPTTDAGEGGGAAVLKNVFKNVSRKKQKARGTDAPLSGTDACPEKAPQWFVDKLRKLPDPTSEEECRAAPDAAEWERSKAAEFAQVRRTFKYVSREEAKGHRIHKSRAVYKRKFEPPSKSHPFWRWKKDKTRYTIAAFTRMLKNGVDYREKFASTPQVDSLKILLSLVAHYDWDLELNDIVGFFLEALLEKGEKIFMEQIPGHDDGTGRILQLIGNLYGLPQGPHHAQQLLRKVMRSKGFKQLASDVSTFISLDKDGQRKAIACIHVDDAVCTGPSPTMSETRTALESRFKLVTTKEPKLILGIQVLRSRKHRWMKLHQRDYVLKFLEKWQMDQASPKDTPLPTSLPPDPEEKTLDQKDRHYNGLYREIVGGLIWLSTRTRPDLAFAVNYHSRYCHVAHKQHFCRLKHTLAYLKGTADFGLVYHDQGEASPTLSGACDADFAGDKKTSRSTAGGYLRYGTGTVSYWSRRIKPVVTSTAQAETYALKIWCEAQMWVRSMLVQLREADPGAVKVLCDNNSVIANARGHSDNPKSRHYRVSQHFLRQKQEDKEIDVVRTDSKDNPADFFTKSLPFPLFDKHRRTIMGDQRHPDSFKSPSSSERPTGRRADTCPMQAERSQE